jgi:hypothetical protein
VTFAHYLIGLGATLVVAGLAILGATFGPRLIDRIKGRDPGYLSPDEVQATAERIYQITHPLEDEQPTVVLDPVRPEPTSVAWYDLPSSPDEATPAFPRSLPVLEVDLSFTRQWRRDELMTKLADAGYGRHRLAQDAEAAR